MFAFFVTFFMLFPPLPLYIEAHGGNESLIGAMVGGASLTAIAIRPFSGRLVDRFGRKPFLTLGMALLAVSMIGYDFVVGIWLFWIMRIMAGAAVTIYITGSMAYVADIAPASERGRAMGYLSTFNVIGIAMGPALGAWVITSGSLSGLEADLRTWLPGSGSDAGGEYNFAAVFAIAFLIPLFALATARLVREVHVPIRHAKQSFRDTVGGLFEGRAFMPATVQMLMTTSFVSLNIFMPLYGRELGVANVGLYYTCYAASVVGVRIFAGRALDVLPRAHTIIPSMGVLIAGSVMLGLVQEGWMILAAGGVIGIGHGFVQPSLQALTVDRVSRQRIGIATATYSLGTDIGLGGGGFVMGVVLQATDFRTFFFAGALMTALSLLVFVVAVVRAGGARALQDQAA